MPNKTKSDVPLGFFNIHFVATLEKNERGDHLVSPGNVCYTEKKKNLFGFWFSSLGQQVKFEIL